MADIARAVDADVSTVSRTLSKPRESVRTDKGRAVWEVADRLGYRPNLTAASLRTNATKLIAVFVPRLRDEVLALMVEGIDEALGEEGYQSIVLSTGDDPATQVEKLGVAVQRGVDGILIGDAVLASTVLAHVESLGIPYFLFNRPQDGHNSATCQDFEGGVLAARHLMEVTSGPLALYAGMDYALNLVNRGRGFAETVAAAGRTVDDGLFLNGGIYAEDGARAARLLIEICTPPFGVFAANDSAAIGVLGETVRAGLVPGRDVFIVGFNDISLARAVPISLTTIASPTRDVGAAAAKALLELLGGGAPASVQLPTHLIVRESSTPV